MIEEEKEVWGDMDDMVITARQELEVQYREIKEQIKKMKMNDGPYYKELMSIFECDPT